MRYGFLGPHGTFTEAALKSLPDVGDHDLIPYPTVSAALTAVREGLVDATMVPLENSIEGGVSATVEELVSGPPLHIIAEVQRRVEFALMALPGVRLDRIRRIVTHPHAAMQCKLWLQQWLPNIPVGTSASTGAAAQELSREHYEESAAIAPPVTAPLYGLQVLANDIGDRADAVTRFVLVRRPGPNTPATGADRTSVVALAGDGYAGWLGPALNEFLSRGLSVTRIESRPKGDGLGHYNFLIDCEGHIDDAPVGDALGGLQRHCAGVKFLGSYPRAQSASP